MTVHSIWETKEEANRAFEIQNEAAFIDAINKVREAARGRMAIEELLDDAIALFPLGECMEPLQIALNHLKLENSATK